MTESDIVHRLLYLALVEIRGYGAESKHEGVYSLANLFHNVALKLGRAARSEVSYKEVFDALVVEAKLTNCDRWLQTRLNEIEENHKELPGVN